MAKSSINIQISSIFAFFHAAREALVTYVIDNASKNIVDRDGNESYKYYLSLLEEAIGNYMVRTGQSIQTSKKKFIWEAVVNLNEDHTLKDLKLLARILRMKFGWQAMQLSVHKDEGHIDLETGKKIYNFHGHLVFFMLNKQGIYSFKKGEFGIKRMEELQTLVARILKMERGTSKKITKRVRLDHKQYRMYAKEKERYELTIKDLTKVIRHEEYEYNTLLEKSAIEIQLLTNEIQLLTNENEELSLFKKNVDMLIADLKHNGILENDFSIDNMVDNHLHFNIGLVFKK